MPANRRTFLTATAAGVASAAAVAATIGHEAAAAQGAHPPSPDFEMPRNMTLLNMRAAAGLPARREAAARHSQRGGGGQRSTMPAPPTWTICCRTAKAAR